MRRGGLNLVQLKLIVEVYDGESGKKRLYGVRIQSEENCVYLLEGGEGQGGNKSIYTREGEIMLFLLTHNI